MRELTDLSYKTTRYPDAVANLRRFRHSDHAPPDPGRGCSRRGRRASRRSPPTAPAPAALDPVVVTATRSSTSAASTCRRPSTASTARRSATGSLRSTCPNRWCACRACSPPTARTTRRTCRSVRAASARARRSACAACGCTRTAFRRRCRTGRGRPGASACFGAAHRGAARAVLDAVRQRGRRRDLGVHGGPAADAGRRRAVSGGSYGTCERRREGERRRQAPSGYVVAANHFATDGYRDTLGGLARARQRKARSSRRAEARASR